VGNKELDMAHWQRWMAAGVVAGAMTGASGLAAAAIGVPGTSNPKLAGMPDGTTASLGDTAPAQSPVLVTGLALQAGQWLQFSATGFVGHCDNGGCPAPTPDGALGERWTNEAENGISGISQAPLDALVGVFLGPDLPSATAAPDKLDFSDAGLGLNFSTLAPALKQVFFIGDGLATGDVVQQFQVPIGATRLYLATHDGFGWFNNSGAISARVSAVPEPAAWALLLAGACALAVRSGRRSAAA
jgi:hypothetical protein